MQRRKNIIEEWEKFSASNFFLKKEFLPIDQDEIEKDILELKESAKMEDLEETNSETSAETATPSSKDFSCKFDMEKRIALQRDRTCNEWNDFISESHPKFTILKNQLSILKVLKSQSLFRLFRRQ